MTRFETFEANTFSVLVTWALADGSAKDLTGATVEASARSLVGGAPIAMTATVADGAGGQVRASSPAFAFALGSYDIQIVVTKDGITRTYENRLVVRDSIKEAS